MTTGVSPGLCGEHRTLSSRRAAVPALLRDGGQMRPVRLLDGDAEKEAISRPRPLSAVTLKVKTTACFFMEPPCIL